jgi:hypothetical protein
MSFLMMWIGESVDAVPIARAAGTIGDPKERVVNEVNAVPQTNRT